MRGVSVKGCLCPGGSLSQRPPSRPGQRPPPPVERMTYACENTTFPKLRLQAVTINLMRELERYNLIAQILLCAGATPSSILVKIDSNKKAFH